MTGPTAPRHVDAPRQDVQPRASKPRTAETAAFPSLLADEPRDDDNPLRATPFEQNGVLGRRVPASLVALEKARSTDRTPAEQSASTAGEPAAAERDEAFEARSNRASPSIPANAARAGPPNIAQATQDEAKPAPRAMLATEPVQVVRRVTRTIATPAPPRMPARNAPNRSAANTIFVAIHAVEQGCAVYARAGRMSATDRENLRQSMRALLAEHGLSAEHIRIDGDDFVEMGGDQWQR